MAHREANYKYKKNGHPQVIPKTKSPYTLKELLFSVFHQDADAQMRFEHRFSEAFGFPYGLFFNYGRSGLYVLLKVLGYAGEEVVVPSYTCVVVAHAIELSGNIVKFVDNEPGHFNVFPAKLSTSISRLTKMIIPTPLLGYPIDRKGYENVISKKAPNAFVLYDTAHGFGTEDQYGLLTRNADGAFVGLGEGKVISSLYGGMLLLRDKSIFEAVKTYRDNKFKPPNIHKSIERFLFGLGYFMAFRNPFVYLFDFLENKTRLLDGLKNTTSYPSFPKDFEELPTRLQATLGLKQLDRYDQIIEERRKISCLYEKKLQENGFSFFKSDGVPTYSHFPILTKDRNLALNALRRYRIVAGYPFRDACTELPGYKENKGNFPNAALMARKLVTLPIWPGMTHSQIDCVIRAMTKCQQKCPNIFERSSSALSQKIETG